MHLEQMQSFVNRLDQTNFSCELNHHANATVADCENSVGEFITNCVGADHAGGLRAARKSNCSDLFQSLKNSTLACGHSFRDIPFNTRSSFGRFFAGLFCYPVIRICSGNSQAFFEILDRLSVKFACLRTNGATTDCRRSRRAKSKQLEGRADE